ncbi:hypothetical protein D9615_004915 [Tricholomella constricta]|uniref:R3H domain-containing protein n=1 Tax=Tricholomella constricta TaxID=117010 RepID=A0A8H5HGM7_9AGAR|nr:hypothetical protein D9615_004915 [Tricholomella constricta]
MQCVDREGNSWAGRYRYHSTVISTNASSPATLRTNPKVVPIPRPSSPPVHAASIPSLARPPLPYLQQPQPPFPPAPPAPRPSPPAPPHAANPYQIAIMPVPRPATSAPVPPASSPSSGPADVVAPHAPSAAPRYASPECKRPFATSPLASAAGKKGKKRAGAGPIVSEVGVGEERGGLHECDLVCGKILGCGLHRCEERDHKGVSPPCLRSSFEEVDGVLLWSYGIRAPDPMRDTDAGTYRCPRPLPCGHSGSYYQCHEDPTVPTVSFFCNETLGRVKAAVHESRKSPGTSYLHPPLSCSFKAGPSSPSPAHAGAFVSPSIVVAARKRPPGANRPRPNATMSVQLRSEMHGWGITAESREKTALVTYHDEVAGFARANSKFLVVVEKAFDEFVTSQKKTQVLPHMPPERRKFVHDLAAVYRMDTQMVDQEPHRSVLLLPAAPSWCASPTPSALKQSAVDVPFDIGGGDGSPSASAVVTVCPSVTERERHGCVEPAPTGRTKRVNALCLTTRDTLTSPKLKHPRPSFQFAVFPSYIKNTYSSPPEANPLRQPRQRALHELHLHRDRLFVKGSLRRRIWVVSVTRDPTMSVAQQLEELLATVQEITPLPTCASPNTVQATNEARASMRTTLRSMISHLDSNRRAEEKARHAAQGSSDSDSNDGVDRFNAIIATQIST